MGTDHLLVVALLDGWRCGLELGAVVEVVSAVETTPLPKAPDVVMGEDVRSRADPDGALGVVSVRGEILPVVDVRSRFRLPPRAVRPSDRFLVARSRTRHLVLPLDDVVGVTEVGDDGIVTPGTVVPGLELLRGIARCDDGLILIHDLDAFLSLEEDEALGEALRPVPEVG